MAIPILNHLDLRSSGELRNALLHKTTEASASNVEGKIIYDTGVDKVKFYDGSQWQTLGTSDATGDIEGVTAGDGLTGGGTSGTVSLAVNVDDSSLEINSDTVRVKAAGITNAMLGGSIANAKLANSSITINGSAISLGGSVTTPNTQLTEEQVEDFVGGMVTGNTETGITVTYEDSDGTLDFVVSDTTVAGDSGSTAITPGDTLTIAGGTNVTTAMSGDTLTITATDTNTQLSTEQVQDIVGAMFTGNTETRIAATYQDGDGTIDLVVNDMTANDNDDVSNANLLTRLAALESSGGASNENIVIGTDSGDTIVITGNLQVSGTTTTVNSTTVDLNDHNIRLDSGNSTSAVVNGAGITLEGGSGDDATFTYSTTGPKFELKLGSSYEDLQVDQLIAASLDISGNVDVDGTLEADAITINGTATGALALLDTVAAAQIDSNAVTTAKINADAVTGAKIADDAIDSEHITDGSVDNVHLSGSIANAKLANSAITIDGTSVSLGGSITTNNTQLSIASAAEVQTGTNNTKAVSPDSLAAKSVHATIDVSDSNFTSNLYAEITHSLGTEDVIVQLFDSSSKEQVYADIARTDKADSASTSKIKVSFAAAPSNDIEVLITSIKGSTAGTVAYS
jgi:hypothetical protein